jgi:uncharacterized protein (DUF488 family)
LANEQKLTILTVGHSTRTLDKFIQLLITYGVNLVVDVRTVPRSRHNPQFNKETLPGILKKYGMKYIHMPDIGGLRRPKHDSINLGLRNISFRGYADYMQTKEFTGNLQKIIALAKENRVALLCAEALPWRCHRSLISDALVIRHIRVEHIISASILINHQINEVAHVEGTKITYPLFAKEPPQKTLGDFGPA